MKLLQRFLGLFFVTVRPEDYVVRIVRGATVSLSLRRRPDGFYAMVRKPL